MRSMLRIMVGNERGDATLIATLLVTMVMVVLAFMMIPYFVFIMQRDHMQVIASHALKEAEVAGQVTSAIMTQTSAKLASVGLGAVSLSGNSYPAFTGSTVSKKLRNDADPTVRLVIKYPATNLSKMFTSIGGAAESSNGFYYIELFGRSEAYE